jgi:hypothetical protein
MHKLDQCMRIQERMLDDVEMYSEADSRVGGLGGLCRTFSSIDGETCVIYCRVCG